jgi:hypothetical protein
MNRMVIGFLIVGIMSCTNNDSKTTTDATGTVETIQDTNHLVTDSVEMPDTNTAEIDPMKKRN